MNEQIQSAWEQRNKLRVEGSNLWARGDKLKARGDKLKAEGDNLKAEVNNLWARGDKLKAEGSKLYAEGDVGVITAVIAVYGDIGIEWKNWNAKHQSYELHLDNGEVYGFEKRRPNE